MDAPRDVMQGYSVMWFEAERQWPRGAQLTHMFAQGGVGGLAASACAHFWERLGPARPRFIVVEPEAAPCLFESARAGKPTVIKGGLDTALAGLACGEISLLAWDILNRGADFFVTIEDEPAFDTMRLLASGEDDPPLVVGESGAAGLAALIAVAQDPGRRSDLGLDSTSSVLVVGTEGDTDPQVYERIVGRSAAEVRSPTLQAV
jgi:diaminopropionate ammonia-lyase